MIQIIGSTLMHSHSITTHNNKSRIVLLASFVHLLSELFKKWLNIQIIYTSKLNALVFPLNSIYTWFFFNFNLHTNVACFLFTIAAGCVSFLIRSDTFNFVSTFYKLFTFVSMICLIFKQILLKHWVVKFLFKL